MNPVVNAFKKTLKTLWHSDQSQKDIKSFIEFGFGYIVTLIVGFFLIRMVNQTLSPIEIGKYSFMASLVGILSPVLFFSAPQAYLRFHENHCISRKLRKFVLPAFYFSSLILAVIIWFYTRSIWAIFYAACPLFTEKTYLLRCQMNITRLNILRVVELLLPLLLLIGLKAYGHKVNANTVLFLYGIGYLSSCLFKANELSEADIDKKTVVKYLWPTVFTAVLGMFITNSAVFFTKFFFGYEAAGFMGVAVKALIFINSLFTLFLMFYPMIYIREAQAGNIHLIRQYRGVVMTTVTLVCITFTLFSKWLYWLIGAEKYTEHINLFIILLWVAYFNFIGDIYWLYYAHEVKTWKSTLLKTLAFVIICCGIGFAPRFGFIYIPYLLLFATAIPALLGAICAIRLERKNFEIKE